MDFLVKGVDENGQERQFTIDGESEEDILEKATVFGFTATELRAASDTSFFFVQVEGSIQFRRENNLVVGLDIEPGGYARRVK